MLSKSAAKSFFIIGTVVCGGAFLLLTLDTIKQVPIQTKSQNITESVRRGKDLWDSNNCMGCHTLFGEGAYYAPELTKVYERRGESFIKSMLKDPQLMYPNERKMVKYNFTDEQMTDLVAFFKWAGEVDLNGFPAKPTLAVGSPAQAAAPGPAAPVVFQQICTACHSLAGSGGNIGPALDGVGSRLDKAKIAQRLRDPLSVQADSKMPKLPLQNADIELISAYLSQLK